MWSFYTARQISVRLLSLIFFDNAITGEKNSLGQVPADSVGHDVNDLQEGT